MQKKWFISIILSFLLFSLSGCYDASTIEEAYYIVAMGIDLANDDSYNISIQIAKNSSQNSSSSDSSSSQSSSYKIYNVEAKTINNAISILNNYLNKKINLSHCQAIVFSEKLARQGIGEIINTLSTNIEIRPNTYVLISSKDAIDVLENVSNSGENFSSRFYEYIINSADYTGYSMPVTFYDISTQINNSSGDAKAIYTTINDNNIQNNGIAIFKDDKMVAHTSALNSIAHLLLTNELKEAYLTIPSPLNKNANIDLEIGIMKNALKNIELLNHTPFISYDIYIYANIAASGKNYDYTSSENIEIVEKETQKYLENLLTEYLYLLSKEYNSDVLNFESIYSIKCLTNQDFAKTNFDKVYKDSFFDVNVSVDISSTYLYEKE